MVGYLSSNDIKFSICIINRKMYKMNIKSASHEWKNVSLIGGKICFCLSAIVCNDAIRCPN